MNILQLIYLIVILSFNFLTPTEFNLKKVCEVYDYQTKENIGKELIVCGKVFQTYSPKYTKGNPTFLNFGANYPNNTFTVVVWEMDRQRLGIDLASLKNKVVSIKGLIREHNGKPEVVLKSRAQIISIKN